MVRALLIVVGVGLAVVFYAVFIERHWFAVRRHRVPCLPPGSPRVLALHISDLHLRRGQRSKQRFLRELSHLQPHLVLATGDFLGDPASVDVTVDAMSAIGARTASMFVLGSNDYYPPKLKNPLRYLWKSTRAVDPPGAQNPWPDLVEGLRARGWLAMNNTVNDIRGFEVLGLDDAHIGRADMKLASARAHEGFRLVVAHSPDVVEPLKDLGYDLIVCGHTHGGQVCLPFFGALVTNCDLPRRMARGLHRVGETWVHVCAGLGTSMYAPFRLACRPEVCMLELVARDG